MLVAYTTQNGKATRFKSYSKAERPTAQLRLRTDKESMIWVTVSVNVCVVSLHAKALVRAELEPS